MLAWPARIIDLDLLGEYRFGVSLYEYGRSMLDVVAESEVLLLCRFRSYCGPA